MGNPNLGLSRFHCHTKNEVSHFHKFIVQEILDNYPDFSVARSVLPSLSLVPKIFARLLVVITIC